MYRIVFIVLVFFSLRADSQDLSDLAFGTSNNLDLITWNLQTFAKDDQTTIDSLTTAIIALDVDVIAIQEISNLFGQNPWTLKDCISYAQQNNLVIKQGHLNLELSNGNLLKSLFNLNLPENLYKDVFSSDELSKKTFSYIWSSES